MHCSRVDAFRHRADQIIADHAAVSSASLLILVKIQAGPPAFAASARQADWYEGCPAIAQRAKAGYTDKRRKISRRRPFRIQGTAAVRRHAPRI